MQTNYCLVLETTSYANEGDPRLVKLLETLGIECTSGIQRLEMLGISTSRTRHSHQRHQFLLHFDRIAQPPRDFPTCTRYLDSMLDQVQMICGEHTNEIFRVHCTPLRFNVLHNPLQQSCAEKRDIVFVLALFCKSCGLEIPIDHESKRGLRGKAMQRRHED